MPRALIGHAPSTISPRHMEVIRYELHDDERLTQAKDGELVYYPCLMHAFKEALEHGLTLEQAIKEIERINGA